MLASALADMAFFQTIRGRGIPTALIERALELEDTADEWRSILGRIRPAWVHGMLLEWAGDLDAARSTLTALRDTVLARGDEHTLSYVASHLGRVECLAGNWELASHYAAECFEAAVQTAQEDQRPFALSTRALVDAHLGRVAETRAATDEGLPLALAVGVVPAHLEMLAIRGFLEYSLGEAREAHRFLGPLPRAVAEAGFGEPALFRFHGDAIETLLALGEHDAATALLAELEEQARATGGVWALTIASRCRALLSAAAGDSDAAYASLDRALELHEQLQEPFERGRTLLVRGTLQRRNRKKRPARESLTQALAVFDELGAGLWSERARAELRRIGGRAPATPACLRRPRNESLPSSLPDARTARWRTPCSSAPRRFSGTSRRSIGSSAFVPAPNSPPSWPPVKLQPFRRFPSRSSPLKTGGSADFALARPGLPSRQVIRSGKGGDVNIASTIGRIAAVLATVSALTALAGVAQAGTSRPPSMSQAEYQALMLRSEALNQEYGLGRRVRCPRA